MSKFLALFLAMWKQAWRDRTATFFGVAFPVLFLLIFGFIFGGSGTSAKTAVVVADYEPSSFSDFGDVFSSLEEIKDYYHEVAVIKSDKIIFIRNTSDEYYSSLLDSWEMSLKTRVERLLNRLNPVVIVEKKAVGSSKELTPFDYTLTGVIAISLLSIGLFGTVEVFSHYRERGFLKRLKATPIGNFSFVFGLISARMFYGIVSTSIILILGVLIFDVHYSLNVPFFLLSVVSSVLSFIALGAFISLVFKKSEIASEVAVIIFTIMMFLAGVYFPVSFLPRYLKFVSYFLPVKYGVELIRYSMGFEIFPFSQYLFTTSVMFLLGLAFVFYTSILVFREED
ncbi:ABC transporter permease [Thermotoga sp. KOL6]|uniref:ABC transporter permease n=1 Tax=Thermotoga sp. KOL6 TaxID=126741 RepID=UPI000C767AA6|nr:ABC transporter permease [Thermotoga sp. KOL6]PLV59115.1 ABC transporter [Thermotoga sp. KOL6]